MRDKIARMLRSFLTKQFLLFLVFSGIAALVNIGSRVLFDIATSYEIAIVLAYCCGMVTAFTLNKYFNFKESGNRFHFEAINFIAINLIGLLLTMSISVILAYYLLPSMGITTHRFLIAHIIGTGAPAFTSFLGHKYITFGDYSFSGILRRIVRSKK
jgi:putative flippase GtrA